MALPFLNWLVDIMPDNSPSKRLVVAIQNKRGADAAILSHSLALGRQQRGGDATTRPTYGAGDHPTAPWPRGYTGPRRDTLLRPSPRPRRPRPERRPRYAATPPWSEHWRDEPLPSARTRPPARRGSRMSSGSRLQGLTPDHPSLRPRGSRPRALPRGRSGETRARLRGTRFAAAALYLPGSARRRP